MRLNNLPSYDHLALLRLWRRPTATAPIQLLAWVPPCALVVVIKRQKKKSCNFKRLNAEVYIHRRMLTVPPNLFFHS